MGADLGGRWVAGWLGRWGKGWTGSTSTSAASAHLCRGILISYRTASRVAVWSLPTRSGVKYCRDIVSRRRRGTEVDPTPPTMASSGFPAQWPLSTPP